MTPKSVNSATSISHSADAISDKPDGFSGQPPGAVACGPVGLRGLAI
jgi:hypothetical protein